MSQNLDPDAMEKFNETIRELNNTMPSFILGINQVIGVASGSVKASDALKKLADSAKEGTAYDQAQLAAKKKKDIIDANRENAQILATNSLKQFGLGLSSTTAEFSTFGKAVGGAGDAALAWGKNLGMLGLAMGVLIKATTLAAEAAMKQADNVLKAKDELSKMGVAGGMTAKQLLEMGHAAGYSSEKLGVISKASKSMGTDIMALGGNVKQSIKEFGKITNVGNEVYSSFQRLGVSQEELTENQADYIKLQVSSGRMITEQMKRDGSLKAASLEYTKNLLELSAITGMSRDEAKKANEVGQANFDIALKMRELTDDRNKLMATGNAADKEKAEQINKEIKANEAMLAAAVATKDAQFIAATQSRIATGAWTETSTVLLRTLPNFQELQQGLIDGTITQGDYVKAIAEGTERQRQNLKGAAVFSKEQAEAQGLSLAMQQNSAKILGKDIPAALKEAQTDIKNAAEGKGTGSGTDPAEIARNKMTELTRTISVGLDELLGKASPFMQGFNGVTTAATLLTVAATAAALYLGKLAVQLKIVDALTAAKNIGGSGLPGGGSGSPSGGKGGPDTKTSEGHYKDEKGRWRDSSGKYSKGPPVEAPSTGKAPGGAGRFAGASKAMGALSKLVGPLAGLVSIGSGAMNATEGYNNVEDQVNKGEITKEEGTVKKSEAVGKGIGEGLGGAGGAALGAMIGTAIFPVVGTAIGAALGGWLGSKAGESVGEAVGETVGKEIAKKPVVATTAARASASSKPSSGASPGASSGSSSGSSPSSSSGSSSSSSAAPVVATMASNSAGGGDDSSKGPADVPVAKPAGGKDGEVQMGQEVKIGNEVHKGGTVSWRTNNPGNVSYGGLSKKYGAIGTWKKLDGDAQQRSTGIAIMPSIEAGDNLKMALWRRPMYIDKTIDQGVAQWTGTTGLGSGYAKDLAKAAGASMDTVIGTLTDPQLKAMITKQRAWEGFKPGSVVSASLEGIAEGPESGYAAILHGNEIIKRLTKDSILDKLANTPAGDMFGTSAGSNTTSGNNEMVDLMREFLEKMDDLIDAQSDSNDIQSELLQYSKV